MALGPTAHAGKRYTRFTDQGDGMSAVNIIYLCPAVDTPNGGIKVMYRHAETLGDLGFNAFIYHPENPDFSCTWFEHRVRFKRDPKFDGSSDFLIVPEVRAAQVAQLVVPLGIRYAIFVQNGYQIKDRPKAWSDEDIDGAYAKAQLLISISEHCSLMIDLHQPGFRSKTVRVGISIPRDFVGGPHRKENLVCFMPRKNFDDASNIAFALRKRLRPGWATAAIHGLPETQALAIMKRSRIFLALGRSEGLGLPPLEAALCGNHVIGYSGEGGLEYWTPPNFEEVKPGDIADFVRRIEERMRAIESDPESSEAFLSNIERLAERYSAEAERRRLAELAARIQELYA